MNPKVDSYLNAAKNWPEEQKALRKVVLECGLTEELKWGKPAYMAEGKNIVVIQGFKGYCALLFFKGYLLVDPAGILVKTGPNTKVGRQIRVEREKPVTEMKKDFMSLIYLVEDVKKAAVKKKVAAKKNAPAKKKAK